MSKLNCQNCKKRYSTNEKVWRCECGGLLDLEFSPSFPKEKIQSRKPSMWRYREALPVEADKNIISFDEGFTPLLGVELGRQKVLIKQDHIFPTGSFKDRGASVLISKVKELGIDKVVEDSSGNSGSAIAAYCAKGQIACDIYIPADTTEGKYTQIQLFGAKLNKILGSREDAANSGFKAAQKEYYASHSWNPYFLHGTKTIAFEVWEQLGWRAPDTLILPVGSGSLLLGAYIGFQELLKVGEISKLPKFVGVQSENCAPLYKAYVDKLPSIPKIVKKETLAEGLAIAEPVRGKEILDAVKNSQGKFLVVRDDEIVTSMKEIYSKGFYIEPTSAATIAGVKQYLNEMSEDEVIVSIFTGNGLKTTDKMMKIMKGKEITAYEQNHK